MKNIFNAIRKPKEEAKAEVVTVPASVSSEKSAKDVFNEFTQTIQQTLDIGARALKIAEEKTEEVAKLDTKSTGYSEKVEEVRAYQARARESFKRAEEMISLANSALPKKE